MKKYLNKIILLILCLFVITGCNKKETIEEEKQNVPVHAFSAGENTYIYFAESNIQYNAVENLWRFAENAYDYIGDNNALTSDSYDGWIDLFSWGASGLGDVMPYETSTDNFIYGDGHNSIANTSNDFSLAINNQMNSDYRMFTHDEIHYILMHRNNAEKLFGYGTIDGIKGLFILPDDWVTPDTITFTPSVDAGFTNQYNWYYSIGDNENYNYNIFTKEDWEIIKNNGGVFLPASGMRYDNETSHVGISGHYWTSSNYGEEFANCLCLFEKDLFLEGNFDRSYGLSVRLIKDAK